MESLEIPRISVLSPLVTRILGCNPGKFTLQGTNTYLIGAGRKRVLIDSGEGIPEYTNLIAQYVETTGIEIEAVLLTHCHHDHVNGVQPLLNHHYLGSKINKKAVYKFRREGDELYPFKVQSFENEQVFKGEGFTLKGFHTPGHADDHLVFWLQEEQVLFSGDNVLGQGTAVFENLEQYMTSLNLMLQVIGTSTNVRTYPGHGHYIDDSHLKISEYIRHRTDRENQIVDVLHSHHLHNGLDVPLSVQGIVQVIYKDYPQTIWPAAEQGIYLHLLKLKAEDRVVPKPDNHWKMTILPSIEAKL